MSRLPLLLLILAVPALAQLSEPHVIKADVDGCVRVRADHDVTATEIACLTGWDSNYRSRYFSSLAGNHIRDPARLDRQEIH